MKKCINMKIIVLLAAVLTTAIVFVGCQSMDDAKHNSETSRDGVSGYSMTMTVNPSRVPANDNATMDAKIHFYRTKDHAPVANTLVRIMIHSDSYEYLDPGIVCFEDHTLLTDAITNAAGEATVRMYVGGLGQSIPELMYRLDAQGTVEYEKWNTLIYTAQEFFWIYNPHWDGRLPPDTIEPTAVIFRTPAGNIAPNQTINFYGGQSYDRGAGSSAEAWNQDKAYDEIVGYTWYMGDSAGTVRTGKEITFSYPTVKTYTVQLRVQDDEGFFGTATESVTVAEPED